MNEEAILNAQKMILRHPRMRETLQESILMLRHGVTASELWEIVCDNAQSMYPAPAKWALVAMGYSGDYLICDCRPGDPLPETLVGDSTA